MSSNLASWFIATFNLTLLIVKSRPSKPRAQNRAAQVMLQKLFTPGMVFTVD